MSITLEVRCKTPFTPTAWQAFCQDARTLTVLSPCLLCGPKLRRALIDPRPTVEGCGLHVDHWAQPGHPVMLWPFTPNGAVIRVGLCPGHDYTRLALALLLRAAHHGGEGRIALAVTPDLTADVLTAGQALSTHFAAQRDFTVPTLSPATERGEKTHRT